MMSKLLGVAFTLSVLAFAVSCDRSPPALEEAAIPGIPGPDLAVLVNERTILPFVLFVPCALGGAGEFVSADLRLHVRLSETFDAAGGHHVQGQFQPMGGSGVGQTTGATYRATGITREGFNVNAGGLPLEDTFVNNFRWIGPGPGNNYLVHQTLHITVNENGFVTADVTSTSVDCK